MEIQQGWVDDRSLAFKAEVQQHYVCSLPIAQLRIHAIQVRSRIFADDWDDTGWDAFLHSTKEAPKDGTAQHWKKHAQLEDA